MNETAHTRKSYFYAGCTIGMWATVATAFKLTLQHIDVLHVLTVSSVTATVVLGLLTLTGSNRWEGWKARDIVPSLSLGLLNPFLYYLILFQAYDMLPAQQAQTLNYLWPIVLVLFSAAFLKQRITQQMFYGLLLSFAGVLLIATGGNLLTLRVENPGGVAIALASTIVWAGYWTLNLKDDKPPLERLFVNFAVGTVAVLVYGAAMRGIHVFPESIPGILGGVYIGLFEMALSFAAWRKALAYAAHTAIVSNLVYLAPFFSLLFIAAILHERILPSTYIGLLCIVAGILLQQYFSRTKHAME